MIFLGWKLDNFSFTNSGLRFNDTGTFCIWIFIKQLIYGVPLELSVWIFFTERIIITSLTNNCCRYSLISGYSGEIVNQKCKIIHGVCWKQQEFLFYHLRNGMLIIHIIKPMYQVEWDKSMALMFNHKIYSFWFKGLQNQCPGHNLTLILICQLSTIFMSSQDTNIYKWQQKR